MQNNDISIIRLFTQGQTSMPGKPDHYVWKVYITKNENQHLIKARLASGHINEVIYNPSTEEFRNALDRAINNGIPLIKE